MTQGYCLPVPDSPISSTVIRVEWWPPCSVVPQTGANEARAELLMTENVAKKLFLRVITNTADAATVFTVRKNQNDTALTITVPAGGIGDYTITADVAIADGDGICLQMDKTAWTAGGLLFKGSICFLSP